MTDEGPEKYLEIFDEMEKSTVKKGDGKALSCIARLIFSGGIKKKKIPDLKVGDVFDQDAGGTRNEIRIPGAGNESVPIPNDLKQKLDGYLGYLKMKAGQNEIKDKAPLFPDYCSSRGQKKIGDHLNCFKMGYSNLRKAGIRWHYEESVNNGISTKGAINQIATQFDLTTRQVEDVIANKIQPAGKRKINEAEDPATLLGLYDEVVILDKSDPDFSNKIKNLIDKANTWIDGYDGISDKKAEKEKFLKYIEDSTGLNNDPRSESMPSNIDPALKPEKQPQTLEELAEESQESERRYGNDPALNQPVIDPFLAIEMNFFRQFELEMMEGVPNGTKESSTEENGREKTACKTKDHGTQGTHDQERDHK